MLEILKANKKKIRSVVFLILSIFSYLLTLLYLFGSHDVLGSIVAIFFLFIFLHFLFLDLKKIWYFHAFLAIIWLTSFNVAMFYVLSWDLNVWLILSSFVFNITIFALFYSIEMTNFNSISYFVNGWYIFTLLVTITYSFALIGMFQQFPFTCEWLRSASNKVLEFVEKPFVISANKIQKTIQTSKDVFDDWTINKSQNVLVENNGNSFSFQDFKKMTIDQLLSDQKKHSQWVCNMLLEEINEKYSLKWFKLSAVLLTYFLLYWFIRLTIFVMSFIWFLIFKSLYWLWVYETKKIKKEVNVIK